MWAEKVLRLCLNALLIADIGKYFFKHGHSDPSNAGMCRPACPIKVKSPTVLRETVLPPVFGPVTISRSKISAPYGDRNHFLGVQKRMAAILDDGCDLRC